MLLTKTYQQKNGNQLILTVQYDPAADNVEKIISVEAYNPSTRHTVDVSDMMMEDFNIDSLADRIYWKEIYRQQRNYKPVMSKNIAPVLNQAFKTILK